MADTTDPALLRARDTFKKSGLTLEELGLRMGYAADTARKAAWQLLHRTNDPRLSMLRKLAAALDVPLRDLIE
jgi:transcriptional regulator with XRE-family HTH domain